MYSDLMAEFNQDIKAYKDKKEALARTLSYIQKPISPEYAIYIYEKTSPWQALRALQAAIEPNKAVGTLEVDRQYKVLCAGPPKGQNLRECINDWELLYSQAKAIGHADALSGMITDYFINSMKQTEPSWSDILRVELQIKRSRDQDHLHSWRFLTIFVNYVL